MKAWLILAGLIVGVGVLAASVRSAKTMPPHQSFGKGDCLDCHDSPPRYHAKNQWDINHGRTELPVQQRCETCHEPSTCEACHNLAPATHTGEFRKPGDSSAGAERHILLGRTQPGSCMTCHRNLAEDCVKCHSVTEIQPWVDQGREDLKSWKHILGEF